MSRRSSKGSADAAHGGGGSMRPLVALGLAILVWLPSAKALLHNDLDITTAAVRFLVAVGVSWAGVTLVAVILRGYVAGTAAAPTAAPKRRRTDGARPATVAADPAPPAEMRPQGAEMDDTIIDVVGDIA